MPDNTMLAQIRSLPQMIRQVLPAYDRDAREVLDHNLCLSTRRLFLMGCGDSHHATLTAELAFESLAGLPTEPMTALQFARYAADFVPEAGPGINLVIGISVSGQVIRTLEAMRRGRKAKATVIALCGTPGSRIAQAGDSFCGGFMVGLSETGSPVRAAMYGTVSASFAIEGYGALYALYAGPAKVQARLEYLEQLM